MTVCPQHVSSGVFLSPLPKPEQGARGEVVVHEGMLFNLTGGTDSFRLALGGNAWDAALSTDRLGPIAHSNTLTFTVRVTVPIDAAWYLTDTAVVTATSVTSPTVHSGTITLTTEA